MMKKRAKTKVLRLIGLLFFLLAGVFNSTLVGYFFSSDHRLDDGAIVLVWMFQFYLLIIGIGFWIVKTKDNVKIFVFSIFCSTVVGYGALLGVEVWLTIPRPHVSELGDDPNRVVDRPFRNEYAPFTIQHLHPHYLFFLPWKSSTISKANNAVVSIDQDGFRGVTPQEKGDRKLAFVVGGSTAFGHGSSSNRSTISGYLNDNQKVFHFVNAGVPSWNTTQELLRIIIQLRQYEPGLVIAFNGFNDAKLSTLRAVDDGYPVNTPESFELLEEKVGVIHEEDVEGIAITESFIFFPATRSRLGELVEIASIGEILKGDVDAEPTKDTVIQGDRDQPELPTGFSKSLANQAVNAYVENLNTMSEFLEVNNTDFLVFFQPYLFLHDDVPSTWNHAFQEKSWRPFTNYLRYFIDEVTKRVEGQLTFYDFSSVFNSDLVEGAPIEDLFLDRVHLSDLGNKKVAIEIIEVLRNELLYKGGY